MRNSASSSMRMPMRSKSSSPGRSLRKNAMEKYGKAVTGFSLDTSADLETNYRTMRNLENEYIKSLQQQIYLLELENNYIRHQAAEVMDKQPLMVCEASNSLKKLKEMQERTDGLNLEIHRKEAHISILQQKLNRCEESLRETLLYHDKEKDELTRQSITLRGERELALREVYQKDEQIKELQYQLSNQKSTVTAMEIQLDILRAKLDDETKRANDLERSLIESRSELVEFNTILRQLEVHYQQELNRIQSTPQNEFKDKIRHLEQKLSDAFLKSENDRYIKDKQTDKNDSLLKENVYLSNELEKLRKLAEESQSLFERSQFKQTEDIAELNRLKQREKELMHMNAMLRQDVLLKTRENEKLQQQLVYQEKTSDSLLSGKQIQPDLSQQFEALKKERQIFIESMNKINEQIAEQKIKIDRLEQEKTRFLNNDHLINKQTNSNDNIKLLLNEENLSPININKANTSPTHRKPVDEAIIQAIQRPRK
ncbi:Centrosomal protein of 135 kDa (Cep135 protein) (Centrosomal protein 4), putative [Schistosoma mansoni]|nr:Centrosomal protein of 135 kDa (Cep135 protein) (Centrosomal protein 4), putative [Schistosoma mansoni]|eukprot:XP_018645030.1 Centrosomal protein of 135 kDa (Cep135 protein) (Centrosomal protein 4), putative [Schistosoma mansoni]